jgi:hypothetical protein
MTHTTALVVDDADEALVIDMDGTQVTVALEVIDADRALELLEMNTNNRPVNKDNVAKLARDLSSGDFFFNGDTIRISDSGEILDGQHRLMAIRDSGIPAPFLVVDGIMSEALKTIDQGKSRTVRDVITLRGVKVKHLNEATSIARNLVTFGDDPRRTALGKDRIFLAQYAEARIDALSSFGGDAKFLVRTARNLGFMTGRSYAMPGKVVVSSAILGTLMYHMVSEGANHERVFEFFERIIKGLPDPDCENVFLAARTRLSTTAPLLNVDNNITSVLSNYEVFIRGYNAWRTEKDMKRMQEPKTQYKTLSELTKPSSR